MTEAEIGDLIRMNVIWVLAALLVLVFILKAVRIVPQSEKYVVERLGRLRSVLGPGINLIVPFLDVVKHKVSVLERQLPECGSGCDHQRQCSGADRHFGVLPHSSPGKDGLPYP